MADTPAIGQAGSAQASTAASSALGIGSTPSATQAGAADTAAFAEKMAIAFGSQLIDLFLADMD